MVDVIGAEAGTEQALEQIVLFVGALGALKYSDGLGSPLGMHPIQLLSRQLERLIPGGRPERIVPVGWCGRPVANIGGRSLQQGHVSQALALSARGTGRLFGLTLSHDVAPGSGTAIRSRLTFPDPASPSPVPAL